MLNIRKFFYFLSFRDHCSSMDKQKRNPQNLKPVQLRSGPISLSFLPTTWAIRKLGCLAASYALCVDIKIQIYS